MSAVTLLAPAKLNLTLHITARRPDGYHEIDSLVAFADYGDRITLELSDCLSLEVTGAFAGGLQSEPADNLMMRAAKALQAYAPGKGAHMTLIKNLPVGAGLGGGSSDAAAAIKGLTHLWNLSLPVDTVHATALSLGSDVPVCMAAQPARIQGTGDKVTPVRVQLPRWVVLVNPGKELPTANVYKGFKGAFARTENINAVYGLDYVLQRRNMLEASACEHLPEITNILAVLAATTGCLMARMSGSGATCFGMYEGEAAAQGAEGKIRSAYPSYWVRATTLRRT